MSRADYKNLADLFAEGELGNEEARSKLSYLDLEDGFFKAMSLGDQYVRYGNDVEFSMFDSSNGSAWTPERIARMEGSFFDPKLNSEEMPGITTPFMYIGMLYAFFCWHTEDNDVISVFDDAVTVRDRDVIITNDRAQHSSLGQAELIHTALLALTAEAGLQVQDLCAALT